MENHRHNVVSHHPSKTHKYYRDHIYMVITKWCWRLNNIRVQTATKDSHYSCLSCICYLDVWSMKDLKSYSLIRCFFKTFENIRKLDFFLGFQHQQPWWHPLVLAVWKKSNFLIFSKVLRKGADQTNSVNRTSSALTLQRLRHF